MIEYNSVSLALSIIFGDQNGKFFNPVLFIFLIQHKKCFQSKLIH